MGNRFRQNNCGCILAILKEMVRDFGNTGFYHNFGDRGAIITPGIIITAPCFVRDAGAGDGQDLTIDAPGHIRAPGSTGHIDQL